MLRDTLKRSAGFPVAGAKNRYVKPEELALNQTYAFSFNPSMQPRFDAGGPTPFKNWWEVCKGLFDSLRYCHTRLFCEFSSQGRFHFHGTIKVTSPLFYVHDVPKINEAGSSEMDTIDDHLVWYLYCLKNQLFMQRYLAREVLPMINGYDCDSTLTLLSGKGVGLTVM